MSEPETGSTDSPVAGVPPAQPVDLPAAQQFQPSDTGVKPYVPVPGYGPDYVALSEVRPEKVLVVERDGAGAQKE